MTNVFDASVEATSSLDNKRIPVAVPSGALEAVTGQALSSYVANSATTLAKVLEIIKANPTETVLPQDLVLFSRALIPVGDSTTPVLMHAFVGNQPPFALQGFLNARGRGVRPSREVGGSLQYDNADIIAIYSYDNDLRIEALTADIELTGGVVFNKGLSTELVVNVTGGDFGASNMVLGDPVRKYYALGAYRFLNANPTISILLTDGHYMHFGTVTGFTVDPSFTFSNGTGLTAVQILTALKTVDADIGGVNASTLQGLAASTFARMGTITDFNFSVSTATIYAFDATCARNPGTTGGVVLIDSSTVSGVTKYIQTGFWENGEVRTRSGVGDSGLYASAWVPVSINLLTGAKVKELLTGVGDTNVLTDAEKAKLTDAVEGAEVNVNADWAVTDAASDAFIKNKPTIPAGGGGATQDISGIGTNTAAITEAKAEIATNASAIATNLASAEANTTAIATNLAAIAANLESINEITDVAHPITVSRSAPTDETLTSLVGIGNKSLWIIPANQRAGDNRAGIMYRALVPGLEDANGNALPTVPTPLADVMFRAGTVCRVVTEIDFRIISVPVDMIALTALLTALGARIDALPQVAGAVSRETKAISKFATINGEEEFTVMTAAITGFGGDDSVIGYFDPNAGLAAGATHRTIIDGRTSGHLAPNNGAVLALRNDATTIKFELIDTLLSPADGFSIDGASYAVTVETGQSPHVQNLVTNTYTVVGSFTLVNGATHTLKFKLSDGSYMLFGAIENVTLSEKVVVAGIDKKFDSGEFVLNLAQIQIPNVFHQKVVIVPHGLGVIPSIVQLWIRNIEDDNAQSLVPPYHRGSGENLRIEVDASNIYLWLGGRITLNTENGRDVVWLFNSVGIAVLRFQLIART